MKRGPVIALVIALLAVAWIGSGLLGSGDGNVAVTGTAVEAETTAGPGTPDIVPAIRTRHSSAQPIAQEIALYGRTEAERSVEVRAETDGRIAALKIEEGNVVSGGALIASLDIEDRQARVNEALAQVKYRDTAYKAAEELSQKQFTSEVKLTEEKAELETAKATLAAARVELARTGIKTPFSGIAEALMVELGDYVQVGDVIARIDDLDPIIVAVEVTEQEIARVETGQVAQVNLASGEVRTGVVGFIANTGNSETRTFRVEIEIDNSASEIVAGMTAEVVLSTRSVLAHRLSPAVLTLDDLGRIGVKTVNKDGKVAFHPVQIVTDTEDGVWVVGLPLESEVITVGQEFVLPGQDVTIVEPSA